MIVRTVVRQSRRALFMPPLGPACQRALAGDVSTASFSTSPATSASSIPPSSSIPQPGVAATTTTAADTAAAPSKPSHTVVTWNARRNSGDQNAVARDYITMTKLQRKTNKLGSQVERRYLPGDLLRDPPAPKDVTLELLMAAQTHMGHHTSQWNPGNSRYLHGVRGNTHIIALEQTAAHLRRAARVVEEVAYRGGLILFVGTRRGQMDIVVRAAQLAKGCHLFSRWTPGAITNRDRILAASELRIIDERDVDRTADGFESHLADRRPLTPDLVVVLNPMENFVLLRECACATIPTIGIIDTDADANRVTYAIPANDDSLRSVAVIAGVLGRAGEMGQRRRMRAAEAGVITWRNPAEEQRFMDKHNNAGVELGPGEVTEINRAKNYPMLAVRRLL